MTVGHVPVKVSLSLILQYNSMSIPDSTRLKKGDEFETSDENVSTSYSPDAHADGALSPSNWLAI